MGASMRVSRICSVLNYSEVPKKLLVFLLFFGIDVCWFFQNILSVIPGKKAKAAWPFLELHYSPSGTQITLVNQCFCNVAINVVVCR